MRFLFLVLAAKILVSAHDPPIDSRKLRPSDKPITNNDSSTLPDKFLRSKAYSLGKKFHQYKANCFYKVHLKAKEGLDINPSMHIMKVVTTKADEASLDSDFDSDIRVLQLLKSPQIPTYVENFDENDGDSKTRYLVLQIDEARDSSIESLSSLITQGWRPGIDEAMQITLQLLTALSYLQASIPPRMHQAICADTILLVRTSTHVRALLIGFRTFAVADSHGRKDPASDLQALGDALSYMVQYSESSADAVPGRLGLLLQALKERRCTTARQALDSYFPEALTTLPAPSLDTLKRVLHSRPPGGHLHLRVFLEERWWTPPPPPPTPPSPSHGPPQAQPSLWRSLLRAALLPVRYASALVRLVAAACLAAGAALLADLVGYVVLGLLPHQMSPASALGLARCAAAATALALLPFVVSLSGTRALFRVGLAPPAGRAPCLDIDDCSLRLVDAQEDGRDAPGHCPARAELSRFELAAARPVRVSPRCRCWPTSRPGAYDLEAVRCGAAGRLRLGLAVPRGEAEWVARLLSIRWPDLQG